MPHVAMLRTKLPRTSWFRAGYLMDCTRLMSLQSQLSLHIALSPLLLLFQPPLLTYPIMYIQCMLLLLLMFPILPLLVPANQPHVKPLLLPQLIMLQQFLFLLKTTPQCIYGTTDWDTPMLQFFVKYCNCCMYQLLLPLSCFVNRVNLASYIKCHFLMSLKIKDISSPSARTYRLMGSFSTYIF